MVSRGSSRRKAVHAPGRGVCIAFVLPVGFVVTWLGFRYFAHSCRALRCWLVSPSVNLMFRQLRQLSARGATIRKVNLPTEATEKHVERLLVPPQAHTSYVDDSFRANALRATNRVSATTLNTCNTTSTETSHSHLQKNPTCPTVHAATSSSAFRTFMSRCLLR